MSGFLSNVLKLSSGSVVAQFCSFLLIPLITRIYSPPDLGVLQLFISITGTIAILSCFSYQLAILLPEKDEDAASLLVLCVLLVTLVSLFSGIICLFFAQEISLLLNTPRLSDYMIFIPLVIFLNGMFLVLGYWLSRRDRFGLMGLSRMFHMPLTRLIQILYSTITISPLGLVLGVTGGYTVASAIMLKSLRRDVSFFHDISVDRIRWVAYRYRDFPLFSSWSALANTISLQTPSLMLAYFYTTNVVGLYSLANSAVSIPMGLVGIAIGQVFFQKASSEMNLQGNVVNVVSKTYKRLVSLGVFPMLVLMIIGEELFGLVFGSEWTDAGLYARILAPWMFLIFISSPLSNLFSVFEKQKTGLVFNLLLLISRVSVLYIASLFGGPALALLLFSFTGVIFWLWMNLYLLKLSTISIQACLLTMARYILISMGICLPLLILRQAHGNIYLILGTALLTTLVYYGALLYKDDQLRRGLSSLLR